MGVYRSSKSLAPNQVARIMTLRGQGLNFATIAQRVQCSARTASRVVKREEAKVKEAANANSP